MVHLKITKVEGLEEFKKKYIAFLKDDGFEAGLYELRKETQERVDRGLDYRGVAFEEYADSTRREKKSEGKRISPPNLRDTGDMMNSLSVLDIDGEKVLTTGRRQAKKAQWMIEGRQMEGSNAARNFKDSWLRPPRRFLGANTGDARLMGRIKDAIVRAWNKVSR